MIQDLIDYQREAQKKWIDLIILAWKDPKLKEKLFKNPKEVCTAHGIKLPKGQEVKILENSKEIFHLVLPKAPEGLSKEDLLKVGVEGYPPHWGKIIGKAWTDPKFKEELFKNPKEVCKKNGLNINQEKVHIIDEEKETYYMVFPRKTSDELSDKELYIIAAGGGCVFMGAL